MLSKFVPVLAGVAMAATVGSAFAFDAEIVAPKALRTRPSPRAAVIMVIPAQSVINMERCVRGWCEAAYAGQLGYVYTPVLVSATPPGSPGLEGPLGILTAADRSDRRRSRRRSRVPGAVATAVPNARASRLPGGREAGAARIAFVATLRGSTTLARARIMSFSSTEGRGVGSGEPWSRSA